MNNPTTYLSKADVKLAADAVDILIAVDKTLGSGLTSLTTVADAAAGDKVAVSNICGYMRFSQFANPTSPSDNTNLRSIFSHCILLPRRFPIFERGSVTDWRGSGRACRRPGQHIRLDKCLQIRSFLAGC